MVTGIVVGVALATVALMTTELYCHRALAHRAVRYRPWVAALFDLVYRALVGTDPCAWAIVHRRHHRYADGPDDPHSPQEVGFVKVLLMSGVLFRKARPAAIRPARVQNAAAWAVRMSLAAAVAAHLSVAAFSAALSTHILVYLGVVGSINSLGHTVGDRPHPDAAGRNVPWAAFVLFGQSYQNNHHHSPGRVRMGPFDPVYPLIIALRALGLARVADR